MRPSGEGVWGSAPWATFGAHGAAEQSPPPLDANQFQAIPAYAVIDVIS